MLWEHTERHLNHLREVQLYGGLNSNDPHRLIYLKAWPIGTGIIRRYCFVGEFMSLWRQILVPYTLKLCSV